MTAETPTDAVLPLSELTTLRVGGLPRALVAPRTGHELVETLRGLWSTDEPTFLLGGGSNTFAFDEGFDGTVVRVLTRGIERLPSDEPGEVRLRVEAGESWDVVVARTVANGWAGLEALSGIPGSVGAVPVQNVGAYGVEVAEVLESVEVLDRESLEVRTLAASELGLGYRTSIFRGGDRSAILNVTLRLRDEAAAPVRYPQLADALGLALGASAPVAEIRGRVIALRASKGMVLDPADHDTWSAGSFFTNPIVTASFARALPDAAPRWELPEHEQPAEGALLVKLSAAWLIERAGIHRGFALPGSHAGVSSKHTLALTNRGGATADEIRELAEFVQLRVQSDFGLFLRPEPVILA